MDTGDRLLAALTDGIVDDAWAVRTPDAVRWWADDLAQVVRVTVSSSGRVLVRAETEVARAVPGRTQRVAEVLRWFNHDCPLSILTVGHDGIVRLALTARLVPDDPVLGWVRWLLACQVTDAVAWAELAEVLDGEPATSHHPCGPRDLVGAALGLARTVTDRSWARLDVVDPAWVGDALAATSGASPRWAGPGRDTVLVPWLLRAGADARWADRDALAQSAWQELDPDYGPALVVRTVVPWAVPPVYSGPLVRGLNAQGRHRAASGIRSSWQALEQRPGVALRQVLPLGVLGDAVGAGPAVVTDAVRRTLLAQQVQVLELTPVVEQYLPTPAGADPWLTRPRQRQANTGCS
ncbi:hypothetical protein GCM10027047_06230 [Rhodococcus aerolatus]